MEIHRSSRNTIYKASAVLGGLFFILQGIVFAYSHGTTPQNRELPVLGMEQSVVLFLVAFLGCLCFLIALFGLTIHVKKTGKIGRMMFRVTQTSIIGLILSGFMQNIFVDPRTEWDTPIAIGGWLLQLFSWGIFCVGMISLGILFYRYIQSRMLGFLTIIVGILAVITIQAEMMIYQVSTGTVIWDIIHASLFLPFGLSWILLAYQMEDNDSKNQTLTI